MSLPRFAFTTTTDLAGPLTELGLGSLFLPDDADLTALAPGEVLAVQELIEGMLARS